MQKDSDDDSLPDVFWISCDGEKDCAKKTAQGSKPRENSHEDDAPEVFWISSGEETDTKQAARGSKVQKNHQQEDVPEISWISSQGLVLTAADMEEINGDAKSKVKGEVEDEMKQEAVDVSIAEDLAEFADQLLADDFDE